MLFNWKYGFRAAEVFWTAAPVILSLLRDWRRFFWFGRPYQRSESDHQKRALKIRTKLEHLGLVFIKVGQVISSRGDLLPKTYLNELSKLQDSVQPLPESLVCATLEAEYGQKLSSLFDEFSIKPIATASIGQVHHAVYKKRQVVVKFARPHIEMQLRRDSRTALLLLRIAERSFKLLKIPELVAVVSIYQTIVGEISKGMLEEIDLRRERENADRLATAVADMKELVIPRTIPELCTNSVLSLEYITGTKVSDIELLTKQGKDFKDVMNRLVAIYMRMIVVKGIYHADPHPGNIHVLPDGRILLFDFGIVRTLSEHTRQNLAKLVLSAIKKDLVTVVDQLYKLGIIAPSADRETAIEVARKVTSLHLQNLDTRQRVAEVADTIYKAFKGFPLELPQELVYVFRCLSLLEGLGTRYRPGWNFIADGYPGIRAALTEYLVQSQGGWWNLFVGFLKDLFGSFVGKKTTP
ncbi:MAG: AarF/ABC1/UbiB kinase family protein [Blastocatellia bacterium]|nr:AarF/ABC1/UbiB kinase family protein [Blastocatellia bacterium]